MIKKQDYAIAVLIGFLTGVFAVPIFVNLHKGNRFFLILLPLLVPAIFFIGMRVAGILSRRRSFFAQFSKFVVVGLSNTAIDFGVLNLLSLATGIMSGFSLGGVNVPGFVLAVVNSYFWNKYWVFHGGDQKSIFHDFPKFVAVSVIGLFLNSGTVVLATTAGGQFGNISPATLLNIGKVLGSILVLAWNFLGYKFIVFAASKSQV